MSTTIKFSTFKYLQFAVQAFRKNRRSCTRSWALKRFIWDVYFAFTGQSLSSEVEFYNSKLKPSGPPPVMEIPPLVQQLEKATGTDALEWMMRFYYRNKKSNKRGNNHGNS